MARPSRPRPPAPARTRDPVRTRAALLEAARALFSQAPYAQVGIRDLGQRAGVDGALVARYFGSKRALFDEAMAGAFAAAPVAAGGKSGLASRLAHTVTRAKEREALDPTRVILHAAGDPESQPLVRARLQAEFVAPLAAALGGRAAETRATLLLACLAGFDLARTLLGLPGARGAEAEELLADVLACCVEERGPAHHR